MHGWQSYLAMGDSFTEGLDDPGARGQYRGWADRLAGLLARDRPGLRYANLGIRGKTLHQVVAEQLPAALAARADLVTLCAGGNDILRPAVDPDDLAARYESAVVALRDAGSEVVVFTGFDVRGMPLLRRVHGRVAAYNLNLWSIADRHGCRMVDLWSMRVLRDRQAWSVDRLHLSPAGHLRVARYAAEVLGIAADGDWREPWPPLPAPAWLAQRRADLSWTREHFVPWIGRHLRGRSSGDGLPPKRPRLTPVADDATELEGSQP